MTTDFRKDDSFVILCVIEFRINLQQKIKDHDRFVVPVDLFKSQTLMIECFNAALIERDCVVKSINGILVPAEIQQRFTFPDPPVNSVWVDVQ